MGSGLDPLMMEAVPITGLVCNTTYHFRTVATEFVRQRERRRSRVHDGAVRRHADQRHRLRVERPLPVHQPDLRLRRHERRSADTAAGLPAAERRHRRRGHQRTRTADVRPGQETALRHQRHARHAQRVQRGYPDWRADAGAVQPDRAGWRRPLDDGARASERFTGRRRRHRRRLRKSRRHRPGRELRDHADHGDTGRRQSVRGKCPIRVFERVQP